MLIAAHRKHEDMSCRLFDAIFESLGGDPPPLSPNDRQRVKDLIFGTPTVRRTLKLIL